LRVFIRVPPCGEMDGHPQYTAGGWEWGGGDATY